MERMPQKGLKLEYLTKEPLIMILVAFKTLAKMGQYSCSMKTCNISLSLSLSLCLPIYPCIYLPIYLSIYISIFLSIDPSIHPSCVYKCLVTNQQLISADRTSLKVLRLNLDARCLYIYIYIYIYIYLHIYISIYTYIYNIYITNITLSNSSPIRPVESW